ncbi:hypothetical protein HR060_10040 [Catenovulum sp. SM1970]|nr:hypothetical protein [Marinifaba aquimaris]
MMIRFLLFILSLYSFNGHSTELQLKIAYPAPSVAQQKVVKTWINQSWQATQAVLGDLPQAKLPINIKMQAASDSPVPWGQVNRAINTANPFDEVDLHVSPLANLASLSADWTLYHELSHLYTPYFDYASFWLSEGFASYMQNIIMLRAGIYDKRQFIVKLQAGLDRGHRQAIAQQTKLSEISADMWQQNAFQRVHWTGAAFFVEVDYHLHQKGLSLAKVMKRYNACCKVAKTSGFEWVNSLTQMTNDTIFVDKYLQYKDSIAFPIKAKPKVVKLAQML